MVIIILRVELFVIIFLHGSSSCLGVISRIRIYSLASRYPSMVNHVYSFWSHLGGSYVRSTQAQKENFVFSGGRIIIQFGLGETMVACASLPNLSENFCMGPVLFFLPWDLLGGAT
ncbi:hypothetical protein BJX96DRAFT_33318 [Aspergillus floccosus]